MLIALYGLRFDICIACVTQCAGLLHIQAVTAVHCVVSASLSSRPVTVLTVFTVFTVTSSLFFFFAFLVCAKRKCSPACSALPSVLHCSPFVGVHAESPDLTYPNLT